MVLIESFILVSTILFLLYKYGTKNFKKWKEANLKYDEPYPFVGSDLNILTRKRSPGDNIKYLYNKHNERVYGIYNLTRPILVIRDPELIKLITIKDFDHFVNRNNALSEDVDPLFAKGLLALKDQRWREMRNTLSPAFTGSKMRNMFQFFDKCGEQMVEYVEKQLKNLPDQQKSDKDVFEIDCKGFFTRYTCDVIASTAFGIQVDSLKDQNNEFYSTAKKLSDFSGLSVSLKIIFTLFLPKLAEIFRIRFFSEEITNYYRKIVGDSIQHRERNNIVRPDLIHLLLQARKGTLTDDNGKETKKRDLSDDDIVAQSFIFFFAGFDTSSTALSFAAYELSVNPDVQAKLQEEIDRVIAEEGGKITYDGVTNKMKYLEMVLSETLRKWPPAIAMDRIVTKKYVIPKSDDLPEITLNPGDTVLIPAYGLHMDPQYFPNPEKFDPERFSEENKSSIVPFTYLPFGSGPRNCIGNRFALMQTKMCLVHLLRNATIVPTSKTQIPLKLSKHNQAQLAAENGIWVGLKKRSRN